MNNNLFKNKRISFLSVLVTLLLVGVCILFIRNSDPYLNPVIYAEDGVWAGLGLTEGWLYAFIHARPDYFVAINIILLFLSTKISIFITGSPLLFLPQAIAFISYGFYATVATFCFFTVRRVSSLIFALFCFFLVLLLPLGTTTNEIIGRVLQVGFFMPLLVVMLLFWRDKLARNYVKILMDILLLLCAATNPVVFVQIFIYLCFDFSKDWNIVKSFKRTITLIAPFAILFAFLLPRMGGSGGVPGGLDSTNLIEAIIARPLLYPFAYPWYGGLSNNISVILLFLAVGSIFLSYRNSNNTEAKWLILYTSLTFMIYDLATITARPGLTGILSKYQTSFPDRYFMGLNVLIVFVVIICLAQLSKIRKYRLFSSGLAITIFGVYAINSTHIFEFKTPKLPIKTIFSFSEQLCLSEESGKLSGKSLVPIEPTPWMMTVPSGYISKEGCVFKSYSDVGIAHPGDVHKIQPSTQLGASAPVPVLMTSGHKNQNAGLKRIGVMFGTYVRKNLGDAELRLKGQDGVQFSQRFSLSDLEDNKYRYFDVDSKRYSSGEILSITGGGVSTWESHSDKGDVNTCMTYEYNNGKKSFTPGCPLFTK
jgi:hypothetical protein